MWQTGSSEAKLVAQKLFTQGVYDLAWAPSGYSLVAASSDGTIALLQFDASELGELVPEAETQAILKELYGATKGAPKVRPPQLRLPGPLLRARACPSSIERIGSACTKIARAVGHPCILNPRFRCA